MTWRLVFQYCAVSRLSNTLTQHVSWLGHRLRALLCCGCILETLGPRVLLCSPMSLLCVLHWAYKNSGTCWRARPLSPKFSPTAIRPFPWHCAPSSLKCQWSSFFTALTSSLWVQLLPPRLTPSCRSGHECSSQLFGDPPCPLQWSLPWRTPSPGH